MPDDRRAVAVQQRAYSLLTIKSVNEERRTITGIASTPEADRMGDVVEPKGGQFRLPLPLLWQHRSDEQVGQVVAAEAKADGIHVTAEFFSPDTDSAEWNVELTKAWAKVKRGAVTGLSIGFSPLEYSFMKEGGIHFTKWDWYELSCVTIPANAEASIQSIKSFDQQQRAASGVSMVVRLSQPPGASGKSQSIPKGNAMKTPIAEQISALEAKRAASAAARDAVQQKALDEGRTKDESEREQFRTLTQEIDAIDAELVDLRVMEKSMIQTARPVNEGGDGTTTKAGASNGVRYPAVQTSHVAVQKLAPGIEFGRWALAMGLAKGNVTEANNIVQTRWKDSRLASAAKLMAAVGSADLMAHFGETKATVTGGDSTTSGWASQLAYAQDIESEFIEYLRPRTVIGRIDAVVPFRRVPFNFRTGSMTGGTTAYWVGQGAPIPLSKPTTSSDTLGITKLAGMTVVTKELLRLSSPSVERLLRDDLGDACVALADTSFLDPNQGGVANIQPAAITYSLTANSASGTDYAAFKTDIKAAFSAAITANQGISGGVFVMSETTALAMSLMQNSLGQQQFPGLGPTGGTLLGTPVVTSQAAYVSGSPDYGNMIVLVFPREVFLADDGNVSVEVSDQASVQMLDNPTNNSQAGTATTMVSMFQTEAVAIKAVRAINWKARGTRTPGGLIRTAAYA